MLDVAVIEDPAAAGMSLDPVRARLLAEPAAAAALAAHVGLPRQKVNYHLRALEQHRLVTLVEECRRGNCIERVMQATLVRDVGQLTGAAARARQRVATFAVDGKVRFASAADRAAFADELASAVAHLVAKYHDESSTRGRDHRIVLAVHPSVKTPATTPANDSQTEVS